VAAQAGQDERAEGMQPATPGAAGAVADPTADLAAGQGVTGWIKTADGAGLSAAVVAESPRPERAHGTVVPRDETATFGRKSGRVLLFVPRWTFEAVAAPIRLGLWTFNRYQLGERARQIFFNEDGTVGLFPVALFETGFGLNVGGRFIYRDLFGQAGKLSARVSYGGQYRQLYSLRAQSGSLFGDALQVELVASHELFSRSRFYGLGNQDVSDAPAGLPADLPADLIDPAVDGTALATRFRHDDSRVALAADLAVAGAWRLRLAAAYSYRTFDDDVELDDDEHVVTDVYDRGALIGYDDGLSQARAELELTYDTRVVTHPLSSRVWPSTGWRLAGFVGYGKGLGHDPTRYVRYGVDLQRYLPVGDTGRTIIFRLYSEAITESVAKLSILDLPRLGGPLLLRGYDRDRFRDRIAVQGSVEYIYPAGGNLAGFVFVDSGRVFRAWDELSVDDLRVGFGGGVQAQSYKTFLARAFVASSIDGGVLFRLSFDPAYDVRAREEVL
jgi:hypothetical protein